MKKIQIKPRFIEKILEIKQMSIQDFFHLEKFPDGIDIRRVYWNNDDQIKLLKEAQKHCDLDELSYVKDKLYNLDQEMKNSTAIIENIENEITQYVEAYRSLLSFVIEIINKEDIDLRNYSTNITDIEWKSIKRQIKIDNILDE